MTFWDFLIRVFTWLGDRSTRILGLASGTAAIIAGTTGIIPENQLKYWMLGIGLLTFWRGQATSNTYRQAKAIVANGGATSSPSAPSTLT